MNIFYNDKCPVKSAQNLCDKHVVKMPLESAQMLCTAWRVATDRHYPNFSSEEWHDEHGFYKATHQKHPCTLWVLDSTGNYRWLFQHYVALCLEYQYRYRKVHKSFGLLDKLKYTPKGIAEGEFTQPPTCMPDDYKCSKDAIECYRAYLRNAKKAFSVFSHRNEPDWWCEAFNPFFT